MVTKKLLILNQVQIKQKIDRMAYQILEDNLDQTEIIMAGIIDRGHRLAQRLKTVIESISDVKVKLIRLDFDPTDSVLQYQSDIPISEAANKVVILVTDVLNSGRALAYGLGVFLNLPILKIRTVVLIDRSHRNFPVSSDYTGLELATVLKEHVDVVLTEDGEGDAVYLS